MKERIERANQLYTERLAIVGPYANMGMSRRELEFALIIGARQDFTKAVIDDVLMQARKNGDIRKLPALEKKLIGKDESTMTDEQMQKGVIKRLVAREILTQKKAEMPKDRAGWNNIMEAMGDVDKQLGVVENLLKRGGSISDAMKIAKLEYPETQEPIVRFAQELAEKGMIDEDLLRYNQLVRICRNNGIELPTFAHSIVLEAFFTARKALDREEDMGPISKYNKLRDMFVNEEDDNESLSLAEFEDFIGGIDVDQGYKEDDIGLYKLGKDGEKYRFPIGVSDGGQIIFDSTEYMQKREESRDNVGTSRQEGRQTKAAREVMERERTHKL